MTATLKQVRDNMLPYVDGIGPYVEVDVVEMQEWIDAINAHLASAGEPVGTIVSMMGGLVGVDIPKLPPVGTKLYTAAPIDLVAIREAIASLYAPGHPVMTAAANKLEAAIGGIKP